MQTTDFDFPFPEDQIALRPLPRGEARLMVISGAGTLPADFPLPPDPGHPDRAFGRARDLLSILKPGDALALNDTKVLRARLQGTLESGAVVEVLLVKPRAGTGEAAVWECMARPGRKLRAGTRLTFGSALSAEVLEILPEGERVLRFDRGGADFLEALETAGSIPLPPYIRRAADAVDAETYQTVFAENPGSVAAPTASLHLSEELLREIEARGVRIAKLTLHVGAGTFRPVQTDRIEDHPMHSEAFTLSAESAAILNAARGAQNGKPGRVFAVGTTAARVLETCADEEGTLHARSGETNIFMYPGYRWKAVDGLLTNFHWPRSTLFMLVASRLGTERAKEVYADAISRGFRLFSYGDAMLIL
ncbi:MAG: queuosine biosynthesis protein [Fibrobacteria bacterium]|jgi:S-adenosylmethionine:tRNA ribosyltransferase-isomerase|nr:queuosine biosynthesis protein [Fibrobacteria bacterium]